MLSASTEEMRAVQRDCPRKIPKIIAHQEQHDLVTEKAFLLGLGAFLTKRKAEKGLNRQRVDARISNYTLEINTAKQ